MEDRLAVDMDIRVIDNVISVEDLRAMASVQFGDMVKAVVDIQSGLMAIGGELHSDEEAVLLERGSEQRTLGSQPVPRQADRNLDRIRFDD